MIVATRSAPKKGTSLLISSNRSSIYRNKWAAEKSRSDSKALLAAPPRIDASLTSIAARAASACNSSLIGAPYVDDFESSARLVLRPESDPNRIKARRLEPATVTTQNRRIIVWKHEREPGLQQLTTDPQRSIV